jgi:hypothetical protein
MSETRDLANNLRAAKFFGWLVIECGYRDVRVLDFETGERWAAIYPLAYTHAIITGAVGDYVTIADRWCYGDYDKAKRAIEAWSGDPGTEPEGWHRHPRSGRRRPDGDASQEYIEP